MNLIKTRASGRVCGHRRRVTFLTQAPRVSGVGAPGPRPSPHCPPDIATPMSNTMKRQHLSCSSGCGRRGMRPSPQIFSLGGHSGARRRWAESTHVVIHAAARAGQGYGLRLASLRTILLAIGGLFVSSPSCDRQWTVLLTRCRGSTGCSPQLAQKPCHPSARPPCLGRRRPAVGCCPSPGCLSAPCSHFRAWSGHCPEALQPLPATLQPDRKRWGRGHDGRARGVVCP
jgi:hypothetical protein